MFLPAEVFGTQAGVGDFGGYGAKRISNCGILNCQIVFRLTIKRYERN